MSYICDMLSYECDIIADNNFYAHDGRMYQRESFIEESHFCIGNFQNANANGANRRTEHAHETERGETI